MRKLLIQPQARLDLLDIQQYLVQHSLQAANRVAEKIETALYELTQMPGKGHTRRDVDDPQYRFWSVYSYIIAYRYDAETLTVIRIIHGRRDFRSLFGHDGGH